MDIKSRLTSLRSGEIGIIYLGQAGFLVKSKENTILIDPYLSYSVDKCFSPAEERWTRTYAPPFLPEELSFADYVFVSHDHMDHADPETIEPLGKCSEARFVCGAAIADAVKSYGAGAVIGMKDGEVLDGEDFKVKLLPAAHEEIHRNENGDCEECGFLFDFGGITLYHSGDSLVYDGLGEEIRGTDVLLLPVNGNGFFRRADNTVGNMDTYDASRLAQYAKAKLLIPMHYDLYPGNSVPEEAVSAIISACDPEIPFALPHPGEGWRVSPSGDGISVESF